MKSNRLFAEKNKKGRDFLIISITIKRYRLFKGTFILLGAFSIHFWLFYVTNEFFKFGNFIYEINPQNY